MRAAAIGSLVGLCPACKDELEQTPDAASKSVSDEAEAPKPDACDARHGKAVRAEIMSYCAVEQAKVDEAVPPAPWKAAPGDLSELFVVEVRPGEIDVDGIAKPVAQAQFAFEEFVRREQTVAELAGRTPKQWALAIEGDTPARDVHEVLTALMQLGSPKGVLVLATEPPDALPQPRNPDALQAMDDELTRSGKTSPSERAVFLAKKVETALVPCPAMPEVFSAIAVAEPSKRCELLAAGMSEALVECGCAREAQVLDAIYSITVGFAPPEHLATTTPIELAPGAARSRKLDPETEWSEIVATLDRDDLLSFWIEASG